MSGRIQSIQADSTESFVEIIDQLDTEDNESLIFISRYPAARLLDLLDISEIQCYWLTNIQSKGAINPSLEKLNHFTESTIREGRGMLLIEGMEWLASLHGFDAVHSMLRSLSEKVVLSQWSIYISISDSSFNQRELSRILREAPMRQFNDVVEINEQGEEPFVISNNIPQSEHVELDLNDDGTPKLVFLTRLPRSGFSKQILQRRILQWRRMGLDTSDIESSLYSNEIDTMYAKYAAVEEKIRRATELERFVISSISDTQERTIALFRIRQLTGLDELEAEYFLD
ncbi:MAG: DUF835 domain-containing protein [Candidatus Poseidoniaceae archaeon]